jgi:hypothetical protein
MSRSQAGRQHRLKPRLQILTSREVKPDGSALLALVPANASLYEGPLWLIPLPAGEPRHLGSLETKNADIFPDGRIGECPTVRYLVDSLENGAFLPPRETDSTHEWTAALYAATTEPRWKADFCSRYEATWRTGSLRYEVASVPFQGGISARCDVLPGWKMGRLRLLSRPYFVAQPQRWKRTHAANLPTNECGGPFYFAGRNESCVSYLLR